MPLPSVGSVAAYHSAPQEMHAAAQSVLLLGVFLCSDS